MSLHLKKIKPRAPPQKGGRPRPRLLLGRVSTSDVHLPVSREGGGGRMGWGLPRASAGGGAAQISLSLSLSTPHSLRSQGFAALCGFASLFMGSYIRCVCFVEFGSYGGCRPDLAPPSTLRNYNAPRRRRKCHDLFSRPDQLTSRGK